MAITISGSKVRSKCVTLGLYKFFAEGTTGALKAAYDEMQGGELNFSLIDSESIVPLFTAIINATPDDATHSDEIPVLESGTLVMRLDEINTKQALIALKEECIAACKEPDVPTVETEILNLSENNNRHMVTIGLTNKPENIAKVVIEQRFGNSVDDLTEWHEAASFVNVRYPQLTYSCTVPAAPAPVRELRIVTQEQLGLSVK